MSSMAKFARIWRGRTRRDQADAYQPYLLANGIELLKRRGAVRVEMMREDRERETEFMTISYWPDLESMTEGKGGDPHLVHHLERDAEFLLELPERVQILDILEEG